MRYGTFTWSKLPNQAFSQNGQSALYHPSRGDTDDRPEKDERQRGWYTTQECLDKIKEWYSDPTTAEDMEGDAEEIKPGKKDRKGGAMETALRTFAEHYGWDK